MILGLQVILMNMSQLQVYQLIKLIELRKFGSLLYQYGEIHTGVLLFKNLFLIAPNLKNYFPKFKMNNLILSDDLFDDDIFKVHAVKVIKAISDSIDLIDDTNKLTETLTNLGRIHESKGIPANSFVILINGLNATISSLSGKLNSIETINF